MCATGRTHPAGRGRSHSQCTDSHSQNLLSRKWPMWATSTSPPPLAPVTRLPGMSSLEFIGSREPHKCQWVSLLATGDLGAGCLGARMFSLEGTLFLEFLFFAWDNEELEVTLGVTVYLSFILVAQFLKKHKSWGKEAFGESARRTLQRPSFLWLTKFLLIASAV